MTRYKHQYPRHTYLDATQDPRLIDILKWGFWMTVGFFTVYGACSFAMAMLGICPCQ